MKTKYEPNKGKNLRIIRTKKNYSGEASPYWDFVFAHRRGDTDSSEQMHMVENTDANPDLLSDEDTFYEERESINHRALRLKAIQDMLPLLSQQQQRAIHQCGTLGRTLKVAAKDLGVSVSTVRVLLNRASAKIQKCYEDYVRAAQKIEEE